MRDWHSERNSRVETTQQAQQSAITKTTTDLVATIDIDGFLIKLNSAGYRLLELHEGADIRKLRLIGFYTKESASLFIEKETPNAIMFGANHSEVNLVSIREEA